MNRTSYSMKSPKGRLEKETLPLLRALRAGLTVAEAMFQTIAEMTRDGENQYRLI
jgi:hypothetical protein